MSCFLLRKRTAMGRTAVAVNRIPNRKASSLPADGQLDLIVFAVSTILICDESPLTNPPPEPPL
jgi:hypothetical protein